MKTNSPSSGRLIAAAVVAVVTIVAIRMLVSRGWEPRR